MVIGKLTHFGVFTISFGFRTEGSHQLTVASHATFTDVEIPSCHFQWCIWFHRLDAGFCAINEESWNQFSSGSNQDNQQRENQHSDGFPLDHSVPETIFAFRNKNCCQCRSRCLFLCHEFSGQHGFHQVVGHDDYTHQIKRSTNGTHQVKRNDLQCGFQEVGVFQHTFFTKFFPHQSLCKSGEVHWNGVEQDSQRTYPEVNANQLLREDLRFVNSWNQVIQHGKDQKSVPSQRTDVHVCDNPVGKVGNGVYVFQRKKRSFQSSHTISGNTHHHKFEYIVLTNFVPCPTKGEQTVHHSAPTWRNEHDGKGSSQ